MSGTPTPPPIDLRARVVKAHRPSPPGPCPAEADPDYAAWTVSVLNDPNSSSDTDVRATRGPCSSVIVTARNGFSAPPTKLTIFDPSGTPTLKEVARWDAQLKLLAVVGRVVLINEDDQLQALDATTGARLWARPLFEAQVEAQAGPGATLDPRFVSVSDDRVIRLVTRAGEGTRVASLDVGSGFVRLSASLPYVLASPLADEHGLLFAVGHPVGSDTQDGVAAFDVDGAASWFFRTNGDDLAGTFEGRVYLESGEVLDAASGRRLFTISSGLRGAWITHDRLYARRGCDPHGDGNDACVTIGAYRTTDGARLWARDVEADRFSNLAVGRDLSVHLIATQVVWPDHFAGGVTATFEHIALDADGNFYSPLTPLEGGFDSTLLQLGRVLVIEQQAGYRGYHYIDDVAALASPDLIPPSGWIPGRGSRARDFRPE